MLGQTFVLEAVISFGLGQGSKELQRQVGDGKAAPLALWSALHMLCAW